MLLRGKSCGLVRDSPQFTRRLAARLAGGLPARRNTAPGGLGARSTVPVASARRELVAGGPCAYTRSVIPTPDQVLPLLAPLGRSVPRALRDGIEKADELQPDSRSRDNYFWSHCARYYSRASLAMEKDPSWTLIGDVANTGIHIILNSVHRIRVLRSLNDQPPPAGGSRARREAWAQPSAQSALFHTATNELLVDPPPDTLPAMNLLLDWREESAEPIVYVSLPIGPWGFNERIRVHWREPLMDLEDDLGDLAFDPPRVPDTEDFGVFVSVDPAERDAG